MFRSIRLPGAAAVALSRSVLTLLATAATLVACSASAPPEPTPPTPPTPTEPSAKAFAVEDAPDEGITTRGALLAPMPVPVTSFGAATVGQYAYVLGGYFGVPHKYSREGQSKSLWRLNLAAEGSGWQRVGELEAGVQGLALVAFGNEVCRVGGNRITNASGEPANMQSLSEVACFDVEHRSWRLLPPLPKGRSSHEAAALNGTLFVAGGWQMGDENGGGGAKQARWHEDVLALDVTAKDARWRSIAVPFKRRGVGVVVAGGKLIVIGGLTPGRKVLRKVSILDPASGSWSEGPDFPADAFGAAAVSVDNDVYASARDGMVYRWTVGEGSWSKHAQLAFPRFFHQLLVQNNGLIALGGISGMHTGGRTKHVERVPLNNTHEASLSEWTMPYAGSAKNRQGLLLNGDHLYFFGGNNSLGQHDFEPTNFLSEGWRLHLPSMKWAKVADYPHRRQTMQTLSLDGVGISVGGFGHDGKAATSHLESYQFNFKTEKWGPGPNLPRGRTQFGFAAHNSKLWAFGGLNYDPARPGKKAFQHLTNTLVATANGAGRKAGGALQFGAFGGKEGAQQAALPGPRRAFGSAVLDNKFYLVGGMREGFKLVDDCLVYDFDSQKYAAIPCPHTPRLSGQMVALDGKLYILGGSKRKGGKMTPERSVEVFDPATQQWRVVVADVGFNPKHMRALRYGDRLLMVSTHTADKRIRLLLIKP